MDKINKETLDEFLITLLTFEKFDDIFKEKLPKDLVKHIYEYVEPYCKDCENCCKLCLYYCSIDCLRFENRDICCKGELNTEINRYRPPVLNIINEIVEIYDDSTPLFQNDIRSDNYESEDDSLDID